MDAAGLVLLVDSFIKPIVRRSRASSSAPCFRRRLTCDPGARAVGGDLALVLRSGRRPSPQCVVWLSRRLFGGPALPSLAPTPASIPFELAHTPLLDRQRSRHIRAALRQKRPSRVSPARRPLRAAPRRRHSQRLLVDVSGLCTRSTQPGHAPRTACTLYDLFRDVRALLP